MDKNIDMKNKKNKENPLPLMKRLLGYILKNYKFSCIAVLVCILVSALTTLIATLFIQKLIDSYIIPLTQSAVHDYAPLAGALIKLAAVLMVGVLCSYCYNRIMVNVGQGTLKKLRLELFTNMESLPIKYFDTHAHGDIMSVYTNDIDTLRQLISQSIPQVINSCITLVSTFVSMIVLDIPLTIVSVVMVVIMLYVTSKLSALSGKYFVEQQKDIGKVNAYIEEMMEGQKVVKVFCHEDACLAGFGTALLGLSRLLLGVYLVDLAQLVGSLARAQLVLGNALHDFVVGHVGVYIVVARLGDGDRAFARQLDAVGAQVVVDRPELLVVEVVFIEGALDDGALDLLADLLDELVGLLDEVLGQDPLVGLRLRLGFGSFGLRDTGFFRRLLSQGLPFSSL